MPIYIRCPNCRADQNTQNKVCRKCSKPLPKKDKKYIVKVFHNGKMVTRTIPNSLTMAKEIEAKIKQELIGGEYYDRKKQAKENVKYETFIKEKYLPYAKIKKSYNTEEANFRHWILPIIGKKPIKNISPFDIEKIKKTMLNAGKAPRTVQYVLATVRHTFYKAIEWGVCIGDNPVTKVKMPKVDNRRTRFLTPEEAQDLLAVVKRRNQSVYEMCLLSLHTGMRLGEIFNLKHGDLDFANAIIHVRNTKSGKDRIAYMTEAVADMLSSKQGEPNEYVFKTIDGRKMSWLPQSFNKAVKALGLNNGIKDSKDKVVFHTLRHTFASWLVMNGTPIMAVKELMGHETLTMTERYSHLASDTKRQAIKGLEGFANGKIVKVEFGKE